MKILIYIFCAFCISIVTPLLTSQIPSASYDPSFALVGSLLRMGITVFVFWLFFFVIAKAMIRSWEHRKSSTGVKKSSSDGSKPDPKRTVAPTSEAKPAPPSSPEVTADPRLVPEPGLDSQPHTEPKPSGTAQKPARTKGKIITLSAIIALLAVALSISIYFNLRLSNEYQRGYSDGEESGYNLGYHTGRLEGIEASNDRYIQSCAYDCFNVGECMGYIDALSRIAHIRSGADGLFAIRSNNYDLGKIRGASFVGTTNPNPYGTDYDYGYEIGEGHIDELASFYNPAEPESIGAFIVACEGYASGFINSSDMSNPYFLRGFANGVLDRVLEYTKNQFP